MVTLRSRTKPTFEKRQRQREEGQGESRDLKDEDSDEDKNDDEDDKDIRDESEEIEQDDEDPDFIQHRKQKSPRKRAPKANTPKSNRKRTTNTRPRNAFTPTPKRGKSTLARHVNEHENDRILDSKVDSGRHAGLYGTLRDHPTSLLSILSEFISLFKEKPVQGVAEVLQMVLRASVPDHIHCEEVAPESTTTKPKAQYNDADQPDLSKTQPASSLPVITPQMIIDDKPEYSLNTVFQPILRNYDTSDPILFLAAFPCIYNVTQSTKNAANSKTQSSSWVSSANPTTVVSVLNNHNTSSAAIVVPQGESHSSYMKRAKKWRASFEEFFHRLVIDCPDEILFDTDAFDTILSWLQKLDAVVYRPLRVTASAAAYQLLLGFSTKGARIQSQVDTMQHQLDIETNKSTKSSLKAKTLKAKIELFEARIKDLSELTQQVFQGVFVFRYRDTCAGIRALSLESLGKWMLTWPREFLVDSYLKYIGWLLYDKVEYVRLAALNVLYSLTEAEYFTTLDLFIRRFLKRFIEMTDDIEDKVVAKTISVCTLLISQDFIEYNDTTVFYELLGDEVPEVRRAAGVFVSSHLQKVRNDSITSSKRGSQKNTKTSLPSKSHESRYDLIELVHRVQLEPNDRKRADYIVESLHDSLDALYQWPTFSDLLLEEDDRRRGHDTIETTDKITLALLLVRSAKFVHNGYSKSDGNKLVEEMASFTTHFALSLPSILAHYQADEDMFTILAELPRYLDPEMLKSFHNEKAYREILNSLKDSLKRHSSSSCLLQMVIGTFSTLCVSDHPLQNDVILLLKSIADECVHEFHSIARTEFSGSKTSKSKIMAVLSRTAAVAGVWDLDTEGTTFDDCLSLIQSYIDGEDLLAESRIVVECLRLLLLTFLWSTKKYIDRDQEFKIDYKSQRADFVQILIRLFESSDDIQCIVETICMGCSFLSIVRGINVDEERKNDNEELKLASYLSEAFSSLILQDDGNGNEEKEILEEDKIRIIKAITQASLTVFPESLQHLPLLLMGHKEITDKSGLNAGELARLYHQKYRERSQKSPWNLELNALKLRKKFDDEDYTNVRQLATSLSLRYSFAKAGFGCEKLVEELIKYCVKHTETKDMMKFLEAAGMPFVSRLDKSVSTLIATKMQEMIPAQNIGQLQRDEKWSGFFNLLNALQRGKKERADTRRHDMYETPNRGDENSRNVFSSKKRGSTGKEGSEENSMTSPIHAEDEDDQDKDDSQAMEKENKKHKVPTKSNSFTTDNNDETEKEIGQLEISRVVRRSRRF